MPDDYVCNDCKKLIDLSHTRVPGYSGGAGYGRYDPVTALPPTRTDEGKLCYPCCARREEQHMTATGKTILYLTTEADGHQWVVTDWPGHLRFTPYRTQRGRHNIAGSRLDVWFKDHHGKHWHGVNIGDNQILRCKRLKGQP